MCQFLQALLPVLLLNQFITTPLKRETNETFLMLFPCLNTRCIVPTQYHSHVCWSLNGFLRLGHLTLSNPIFLPTTYFPARICFGREKGWWITCNYPTALKEKNMEIQKEYDLRYLLAKVRTT
jgi:hypothetical protein